MTEETAGKVSVPGAADPAAVVLRVVAQVAEELRPGRPRDVRLDSSLERDLGLDSLARAEVLWRLGQALDCPLPQAALAECETPRDFLRFLQRAAQGGTGSAPTQAIEPEAGPAAAAPTQARTLQEVLEWHATAHPQRVHIHFEEDGRTLTYGALRDGARAMAAGLQARGIGRGHSVALMLPSEPDYFLAFMGVLLAGAVPVPIYPPARASQLEEHLRRHGGILENAQARLLITVAEARSVARLLAAFAPTVAGVATVEELRADPEGIQSPPVQPMDAAFLQYTSGSTGRPKGVIVSHAAALANIRAMGRVLDLNSEDRVVSWLPLYHDMGLIGAWLCGFTFAFPLVLLSPLAFLSQPSRWLRAIHRHRATLSAAPNFAYELCLRKIQDAELEGLDLSSLRYVCNGAEPVLADTLEGFQRRFAACGLRPNVVAPVYGLAENTLDLTLPPPGRPTRIERIQRGPFAHARTARPAGSGEADALRFVGCGYPLPGHRVRVVDEGGRELGDREVGRLQFQGPSSTSGYFRNPEATAALFQGDWLETGDLAYLAEGEVFPVGRAKDLIIRGGRNYYPYDLEDAVGDLPGIRRGCVAVFGSADPVAGTERLVVLAETREGPEAHDLLQDRIQDLALAHLGAPAEVVRLVPPHTLLKTSSGKLRRSACRDLFERDALRAGHGSAALQLGRLMLAGAGSQVRRLGRRIRRLGFGLRTPAALLLILPAAWLAAVLVPARAWGAGHRLARTFLRLAGLPWTVQGLDQLPEGPCILVANHASYLDGLVMLASFPQPLAFVAKGELARNPFLGPLLHGLGAAFVDRFDAARGVEDSERLAAEAARGRTLLWFPEGTFQRKPGLLPFRTGAFLAAASAEVPVLPVVLGGTRTVLRDGDWLARPGLIQVQLLPPIRPDGSDWSAALRLRQAARAAILVRCGEQDLGDEASPLYAEPAKASSGQD